MNNIKWSQTIGYFDKKPNPLIICDPEESQTEQSHKDECDINNIVYRFQKGEVLEHRNEHRGEYGYATAETFNEAMNVVTKGMSMFEDLPSHIREKFKNDPAQFLEYVQNDKNAKEMVKLGLATSITDTASQTPQIDPTTLRTALADALKTTSKNDEKTSNGNIVNPPQGSSDQIST